MLISNVIVIAAAAMFFMAIQFLLYRKFECVEVPFVISAFALSTYCLTIFPGSEQLRVPLFVMLSVFYVIYFINRFDFESFLKGRQPRIKIDRVIIVVLSILFAFSVILFNIHDLLSVNGLSKVVAVAFGCVFYCYFLPGVAINKPEIVRLTLGFIIVLGIITGITGIIFSLAGININPAARAAAPSFFLHPNSAAFAYTFSAPVLIYILMFEKEATSRDVRIIIFAGLAIVCVGLLLTLSRAGYLALMVSTFTMLFFKSRKHFLISIIAFALLYYFVLHSFIIAKGTVSSISRLGLLYSAVELLKSSRTGLLWGFGSISVFDTYADYKLQLGPLLENIPYPHNSILFFTMQFGLLSLIALMTYFIVLIGRTLRILKDRTLDNKRLILPLSVATGIFAQSLLEDTVLFPEFFVFHFYLVFIGAMVYAKNDYFAFRKNSHAGNALQVQEFQRT